MALEQPEKPKKRGTQNRIDELESQVQELSGLVEILLSKPESPAALPIAVPKEAKEEPEPHHLVEDVRDSVGRALGGEEGESLESRIGGIWLGRIVAVLFLTLYVLGAFITIQDETADAIVKIAIGYTASAVAIGFGILRRKSSSFFPQTILGAGLAAAYFTTYASFFLENTQVYSSARWGIVALAVTLIGVTVAAHLRRSQTSAGVALFLIYYTVVLSLSQGMSQEHVIYAVITGSIVALAALIFHLTHHWLFFSWGALIATQLTYIYFFAVTPPDIGLSESEFFWYSNAFLTLIFVVFSVASITDARRTGEFRKTVAPMAGVNSFVYLVLTWLAVREHYAEWEWAFRLGQTAVFLVFTAYARLAGPPRNYLFQIFAAKSFIIFTLALQSYLSHEWLLVAMSVECLALGFSFKRSGLVIFKLLGLGLLLLTFIGSLFTVQAANDIDILGLVLPAKWFTCVAVPFVFCIVAWFYEHYIRRIAPHERIAKSQWFMADTWLDFSGSATALLHVAAGAMILMAITIIDLGDHPALPFVLAGEGILMAVFGLILVTPQVEIGSVLLLIASHVTYHLFLWLEEPGFETQNNYALFTLLVSALTFFGGYLWERFLRRIPAGTQWEHDSLACIPYLAATMMISTLMERNLESIYAPLGQMLLGAALLLGGSLTMLVGLRIGGILAAGLGTASFYTAMYNVDASITDHPDFLVSLLVMLVAYIACERGSALWERRHDPPGRGSLALRSIIVALAAVIAVLALWEWAPQERLSFWWMGLAVATILVGVVFRESRYRWAAIALYLVTVVRAYFVDLSSLSGMARFASFAALFVPGVIMAWAYAEYRARHLRKLQQERLSSTEAPIQDGSSADG